MFFSPLDKIRISFHVIGDHRLVIFNAHNVFIIRCEIFQFQNSVPYFRSQNSLDPCGYHFPQIDGFGTFLESVQRTLLRHKTIGWYMWARIRGTNQLLLIYFGRGQWHGHFEQETNKIIPRLWQRRSDQPYMVADTITVNQQNKDDVSDWLARYLIAIGAQQTDGPAVNVNWHKKTFGTAQMTQLGIKKHPSVKRGMSLGC